MSNTDQRLQVILSVVLAKVTSPAVILVTAATARDDSSLLSRGLAAAAKDAGHTAALISLEDFAPRGRAVVERDVDLAIAEKTALNDIVFVDAPSLLNTQFAVHVAQAAAGTVLALAIGRPVTAEDKRAAELLRFVDAKFLGLVTTPLRPASVTVAAKKKTSEREPSAVPVGVKSSLR